MHRDKQSVKSFIEKDLKIETSLNEDNVLIFEKEYQSIPIENAITKYVKKYVICLEPKCGSGDTEIIKENRITYLACKTCCSKKSINE